MNPVKVFAFAILELVLVYGVTLLAVETSRAIHAPAAGAVPSRDITVPVPLMPGAHYDPSSLDWACGLYDVSWHSADGSMQSCGASIDPVDGGFVLSLYLEDGMQKMAVSPGGTDYALSVLGWGESFATSTDCAPTYTLQVFFGDPAGHILHKLF